MYLHLTSFHWLQTFDKHHKETTGNNLKMFLNSTYRILQLCPRESRQQCAPVLKLQLKAKAGDKLDLACRNPHTKHTGTVTVGLLSSKVSSKTNHSTTQHKCKTPEGQHVLIALWVSSPSHFLIFSSDLGCLADLMSPSSGGLRTPFKERLHKNNTSKPKKPLPQSHFRLCTG